LSEADEDKRDAKLPPEEPEEEPDEEPHESQAVQDEVVVVTGPAVVLGVVLLLGVVVSVVTSKSGSPALAFRAGAAVSAGTHSPLLI
jgi:hypothetical protein